MLINEYVLHHANRLLYFTGTKCNLYHFCAAHQKEVGRARWLIAPKNALFPIEENQISTLFLHFSLHLHLFDKAVCVSSDGKWVDKLRQKRAKQAVSLSIYDIICPPDSSACHIGGTRIKEKNKTEGKNVLFFFVPLGLCGWVSHRRWGQFVSKCPWRSKLCNVLTAQTSYWHPELRVQLKL